MRGLFVASLVISAFPALGIASAQAAEPAACSPAAVAQIYRSGDLGQLTKAYAASDDCLSAQPNACIARLIAGVYADRARKAIASGARVADVSTMLDDAFHKYGKPWQLYEIRGDIAMARAKGQGDQNALSQAALNYERAIDDLADDSETCVPYGDVRHVSTDEIARLHQHMVAATLLAPTSAVIRTRDGECGGVFLTNVRDFKVKSTPLPIEFQYNSTKMTPKGEQALAVLSQCIGDRHFKDISLTGHTDMKGSDAYNMALSERRLQVIQTALKASKVPFGGKIKLEAKGKREPLELDDPGQYSQEQIDQMNRRVELRDAAE